SAGSEVDSPPGSPNPWPQVPLAYAGSSERTSSTLRIFAPTPLGAKLAWGGAEAFAEQPAEGAQALETDRQTNRGDGLLGCHEQPAGRSQTAFLQELHRRLLERQLEHPVKMIWG